MAASFFTGRKLETLYAGSTNFSEKITANPTAVGLTALIASAYAALHSTFADLYVQAQAPDTRTKPILIARDNAAVALRARASELAKTIEGNPAVTPEQRASLGLSVRKTPGPRPAPGQPEGFSVQLSGNGALEIAWKCKNPAGSGGTMYQVFRRDTPEGEYAFVGATGQRKLTDATIPTGTTAVTYQMQAVRSTAGGPWATFNVVFGTPAAGATPTVSAGKAKAPSPKLAA